MAATLDIATNAAPTVPVPGFVLSQRYELIRPLGSGSHGDVWQAIDLLNGHLEVAVKLLRMERVSEQARERFARECSALELLMPHPHIVAIRARGSHAGQEYMVLELLRGPSLATWLRQHQGRGLPSLAEALSLFGQICQGVAAAHQVRNPGAIIHRDLKLPHLPSRNENRPGWGKRREKRADDPSSTFRSPALRCFSKLPSEIGPTAGASPLRLVPRNTPVALRANDRQETMSNRRRWYFSQFVNRKYPLEQLCLVKRWTVWLLTRRDYSKNRDARSSRVCDGK